MRIMLPDHSIKLAMSPRAGKTLMMMPEHAPGWLVIDGPTPRSSQAMATAMRIWLPDPLPTIHMPEHRPYGAPGMIVMQADHEPEPQLPTARERFGPRFKLQHDEPGPLYPSKAARRLARRKPWKLRRE